MQLLQLIWHQTPVVLDGVGSVVSGGVGYVVLDGVGPLLPRSVCVRDESSPQSRMGCPTVESVTRQKVMQLLSLVMQTPEVLGGVRSMVLDGVGCVVSGGVSLEVLDGVGSEVLAGRLSITGVSSRQCPHTPTNSAPQLWSAATTDQFSAASLVGVSNWRLTGVPQNY